MKAPWQCWLWIGLGMALHFAAGMRNGWHTSPAGVAQFAASRPALPPPAPATPVCLQEFIDPQLTAPSAHVSSVCELPGGRLGAAWYAGTREGARDVAVYFATRQPGLGGAWSAPRALVTRSTAAQETFRFVKKIGNPVLFAGANGNLCLLYVSVGFGGWSGSSLNAKQSFDGGKTWSASQRLGLSPFFNVSELVKNGPAPLADGGWVVPIYHETLGKFAELLWLHLRPSGVEAEKSRPFGGRKAFQPALVTLDARRALLLCRAAGSVRRVFQSATEDAGRHWTAAQPIELPNPDSGLDALRLQDGRLLLAFNDAAAGRETLRLAVSGDEGRSWRRLATLAQERRAEFSYPFLLQTSDKLVHLTYTWKRRGIKHVVFNLAWLDARHGDETQ